MSSNREIELKLVVGREHLGTLRQHPLLEGRPAERTKLQAVYYDTPKDRLARSGMSLRVRQEGDTRLQTVKAEANGGLVDRGEWEAPTATGTLDTEALRGTPVNKLLNGRAGRLIPKVETRVHRSRWDLDVDGAKIELVVDEGEVLAGRESKDLSEVELELKAGPKEALFRLARSLTDDVPLRLGVESKYQQGQALLRNSPGEVHKAEPIHFPRDATAGDAFRAIVHSCLRHYRLNEPLLLEARNPAALHQCRVSLRRLRSAFSLFSDAVQDEASEAIRRSLKDIAAAFGRARNLDVFLQANEAAGGREFDTADLARLAQKERERAYDRLVAKLNGAEFRSFIIDVVAWLETGEWREARRARTPLSTYGRRKLAKRHKSLWREPRDLETLTDDERHQIRIKAKKLRYACEFLASLSASSKRYERYLAGVTALQESLGELNDAVTTRQLVTDLAYSGASRSAAFSAGAIAASGGHATPARLRAAQKAMGRFRRSKPFW
jgi:triphosphatase